MLYLCLFADSGYDLRRLLRGDSGQPALDDAAIAAAIAHIWRTRGDRYSELRTNATPPAAKSRCRTSAADCLSHFDAAGGRDTITGLVLAGGQGRRMGSPDKGLVEFDGTPLIARVVERFAPQVCGLVISANRNIARYQAYATRVLWDDPLLHEHYVGPLAGIYSGLVHAPTGWLAVVPCDAPYLPRSLVDRLADAVNTRGACAACAQVAGRINPVFCLLSARLNESLREYLSGGGRTAHAWLVSVGAVPVEFDDESAFRDINSADALTGGPP